MKHLYYIIKMKNFNIKKRRKHIADQNIINNDILFNLLELKDYLLTVKTNRLLKISDLYLLIKALRISCHFS